MAELKKIAINQDEWTTLTTAEVQAMIDDSIKTGVNGLIKTVSGSVDNITIGANGTNTVAVDLGMPNGYVIGGYRQISIQAASNGGANQANIVIRWFGSTGGGTKANVAMKNIGAEDAKIKLDVICMGIKK